LDETTVAYSNFTKASKDLRWQAALRRLAAKEKKNPSDKAVQRYRSLTNIEALKAWVFKGLAMSRT
jgi:hypothetical protein